MRRHPLGACGFSPRLLSGPPAGEGIEEYPVFARIFFYASAFNEVDIMQNFLPPCIPRPNQTEAQRSGFGLEKEEGTKGYGACTAGGMYWVSSDAEEQSDEESFLSAAVPWDSSLRSE